ncbi:MAG: DUF2989 domain-containing protein [Leptolyngbyaceae cyanobacterium RU_5_1]|nr:DUF2989 domain-containing protein [Leptolyngbyaceae cyanobacterium RU_5_1]
MSQANRANQLLDRRVNEWLGNQRNSRYLFGWRELWLLKQQEPYLLWGANRRQKEQLLTRSRQRLYGGLGILSALVIGITGFLGWLNYTPHGQIQQVRWELANLVPRAEDSKAADAAVAFAIDGDWQQVFRIVDKHVTNPSTKSQFLSGVAEVIPKLDDPPVQAKDLLNQVLKLTEKIDDPDSKTRALSAIAGVYGQLQETAKAKDLLHEAFTLAEQGNSSDILKEIAVAYARLGDWRQALKVLRNCREDDKVLALTRVLTAWAEQRNPRLREVGNGE